MRAAKEKQFSVGPSVVSKFENDVASVLDFRNTDSFYEISGPGAVAWQKIVDGRSSDQIIDFIAKKFKAPRVDVEAEFQSFVKKMTDIGLLTNKK